MSSQLPSLPAQVSQAYAHAATCARRAQGMCNKAIQKTEPVVVDACGMEAAAIITASPAVLNVSGLQGERLEVPGCVPQVWRLCISDPLMLPPAPLCARLCALYVGSVRHGDRQPSRA